MSDQTKKYLMAMFLIAHYGAIFYFWWVGSGSMLTSGDFSSELIAVGRLVGLLAMTSILLQLLLISRAPFIEQTFGHDRLNRIHRIQGYTLAVFIIFHPLLIIWGYARLAQVSWLAQLVDFWTNWEDILKASIGFVLLMIVVSVSIPIIKKKIRYEAWYFMHLLIYGVLLLIFDHQVKTADFSLGVAYYYWYATMFGVFGLVFLTRWLRPFYTFYRHRFYIDRLVPETHDVTSVYIKGKDMQSFHFQPGQFSHYNFLQKGMWYTHPFSFSAAPNGEYIRISVKNVGDFTSLVPQLKQGTRVIVDGPLGVFTEKWANHDKYLFIAGGIGITPIRSMIEDVSKKHANFILLYANKTEADIVFRKEFDALAVKRYDILSQTGNALFEKGFIDAEKIKRLVPDFLEREIYLCGPPLMMKAMLLVLKELGVNKKYIHYERFGY